VGRCHEVGPRATVQDLQARSGLCRSGVPDPPFALQPHHPLLNPRRAALRLLQRGAIRAGRNCNEQDRTGSSRPKVPYGRVVAVERPGAMYRPKATARLRFESLPRSHHEESVWQCPRCRPTVRSAAIRDRMLARIDRVQARRSATSAIGAGPIVRAGSDHHTTSEPSGAIIPLPSTRQSFSRVSLLARPAPAASPV
jgi:hypothetical protein